jgi:hypothetical protein
VNREMVAGLSVENLEGFSPFLVSDGRGSEAAGPFRDHGGRVERLDIASFPDGEAFLVALHEILPLPYDGLSNWNAFADSYEEIAELWPADLMLLLEQAEVLARNNLHLLLQLADQMENARDGLAEFGVNFWPVFCRTA